VSGRECYWCARRDGKHESLCPALDGARFTGDEEPTNPGGWVMGMDFGGESVGVLLRRDADGGYFVLGED
jgi:hypothetical protein